MTRIDDVSFDLLFRDARTYPAFLNKPVDHALLFQIYDFMKWGPTSMNMSPLRIVFVTSPDAKAKLKPCLMPGNVDKTMAAPVTAIFAYDLEFYEKMSKLWPHSDAKALFAGKAEMIEDAAFRNATLQAAYFMIAARGLGLDCGPMSGFHRDAADAAFLAGTPYRSNFLCNLGYGDKSKLYPRAPRLDFDEVATII
ncbi:malonic semialdehyde reductase [Bryobacter aggregatus]|uniref:malonic semialdehyde reductase n=1 Tax=Bryobacter aggregatus TaxID=360054 RepID=UPI0004E0B1CE|nr:malonic semialdehyde reductase [Bryobacter aggregatus]